MPNHTPEKPLIELRHVSKAFEGHQVLDGLDLRIERGQSIVVIGASGSGKSVLLKHIVGLLKPDSGEVWFDGQRVDKLSERRLQPLRCRLGFLFQMGALFDSETVGGNVAFPLLEHTHKSRPQIAQIVAHKLRMVGLPGIEGKMPAELSGGQKKRVGLARAIVLEPEVMLYDEPTTGLDPVRADIIDQLILKLRTEMKVTSISVTHDMKSAFKIADRIVMLHQGKLIVDGSPAEIQACTNPLVSQFIEGRASEEDLATLK